MGRFHVCMPVAAGEGYCCALCRRDMNWEMSQYTSEASASPWEATDPVTSDPAGSVLHGCAAGDLPRDP